MRFIIMKTEKKRSDLQYIKGGKYNHWILKHNEGIEKKKIDPAGSRSSPRTHR